MISADSDTEKFYTEVQEKILARYNKTFDWSLKAKMMGKKAIEAAQVFVEESGISDTLTAEGFLVEREAVLQSLFPTSELMPGTVHMLTDKHEYLDTSAVDLNLFTSYVLSNAYQNFMVSDLAFYSLDMSCPIS